MNFATLTTYEENLLLTTRSGEEARNALETAGKSGFQIGIVSDTCPLLSGLSLAENLALGNMYHQNFFLRQAIKRLRPAIKAAGLEGCLDKGIEDLTRREIVQAYFLRCLAANNSIVLVDNPRLRDLEVITELNCIDSLCRRLWVLCREQDDMRYASLGFRKISIAEAD
jgi:ABC-type uncharacterized transport system ATPase subunit